MDRDKVWELTRLSHLDVYGMGKDREKFLATLQYFVAMVEREGAKKDQAPMHWHDDKGNLHNRLWESAETEPLVFNTTFIGNNAIEVLRITKDGVWANPDMSVDEAAKAVLAALDGQIKEMVARAVAEVRGDGEPVAWMYDFLNPENRDEVIRNWVTQDPADIKREKGFNVRPLFAHPVAAKEARHYDPCG